MNRYGRQVIIPNFGTINQNKLITSKVLVVGAGGLGVPVIQYLIGAGIGNLGIIDSDTVDLTNLHRQILYDEDSVGKKKVDIAKRKLEKLNSEPIITTFPTLINDSNVENIIKGYDVIVDGTDNFPTKYLINDTCVKLGKPLVYGAVDRYEGQVSVFNFEDKEGSVGPQIRDVFEELPLDTGGCNVSGVLGTAVGIVGTIMAHEVIKIITGIGSVLTGEMLMIDTNENDFRKIKIKKKYRVPLDNGKTDEARDSLAESISWEELKNLEERKAPVLLIDVREGYEFVNKNIGGVNIPLSEFRERIVEIESFNGEIVICCQSGIRSLKALRIIKEEKRGLRCVNLMGGINAYLAGRKMS